MKKVISILIAMLLVMAAVAPAMASCPYETGNEKGVNEAGDVLAGDVKELQGAEKSRVASMALGNEGVKKLQKQLENEGYTQKDLKACIVPVKAEDGSIVEMQIVAIMYESSNNTEEDKVIASVYNPETGEIMVILGGRDLWECLACCGACLILALTRCPFCAPLCSGCATLLGCIPCALCLVACGALAIGSCHCCLCDCMGLC